MEIERKYLIHTLPENLDQYPSHKIEQGYLNTSPVVRIRQSDDEYYLTYKGGGLLAREEYNLPLTKEAYEHMRPKADGIVLSKRRYLIPLTDKLTIELDVFDTPYKGLYLAEVEFETLEEATNFTPPEWFGPDVTLSGQLQNSLLSRGLAAIKPSWD
ncbi:MAG: CYTH domain-containing protein [Lachnospiraceae bacterium]|nr:CYTH domain-containing protein [Lachnospiraceae bacterium]